MKQPLPEIRISLYKQEHILSLGWSLEHEFGCSFSYMSQGCYRVGFPAETVEEDGLIYLPCGAILKYTEERAGTWRDLRCYGSISIVQTNSLSPATLN